MSEKSDHTRNSGEMRCSSPASETPIELQRFGPPPFKRPTMEEFEDAMIESIDQMTKEEIEAELREAGIDMAPAIARMHAMIEAKKAGMSKAIEEWMDNDKTMNEFFGK